MKSFLVVRGWQDTAEEIFGGGGHGGQIVLACGRLIGENIVYVPYFCVWDKYPSTVSMRNIEVNDRSSFEGEWQKPWRYTLPRSKWWRIRVPGYSV